MRPLILLATGATAGLVPSKAVQLTLSLLVIALLVVSGVSAASLWRKGIREGWMNKRNFFLIALAEGAFVGIVLLAFMVIALRLPIILALGLLVLSLLGAAVGTSIFLSIPNVWKFPK